MGWSCCPAVSSFVVLLLLLSEAPVKEACGTRPLLDEVMDERTTETRIVGGQDAQLGAWPWQVSLQVYQTDKGYFHVCGGSLINHNTVLSAAHCIQKWMNPGSWTAVIGLHNILTPQEYSSRSPISAIIIHNGFNKQTHEKDIALLKLANSIKFNKFIQPVCLPDGTLQMTPDTPCYITGWGNTKEKESPKAILQEAQVNIIPQDTCNRHDWYRGTILNDMFCAGHEAGGIDSCQGDSGGPLVCYFPDNSRYYQIGITSAGLGCGRPKFPGIYVRTASYRRWIRSDGRVHDKTTTVSIPCVLIFWSVGWTTLHLAL